MIITKPFGRCHTNCYIIKLNKGEIIIDPGENAFPWVMDNIKNPLAILNTHGHYDHIWSDVLLCEKFPNLEIYIPENDEFMLKINALELDYKIADKDTKINKVIYKNFRSTINIADEIFTFMHYAGHSPGCSMILYKDIIFSGDFLFDGAFGRVDIPHSSPSDMKDSLKRFLSDEFSLNYPLYPGHGGSTTIMNEKSHIPHYLEYFANIS